MPTNFGLSADFMGDVMNSSPDYASAASELSNVFADIGDSLGKVQRGQRDRELAMLEYAFTSRQQTHKETMDILKANQLASDSRFKQNLEALSAGLKIQKDRLELQALERSAAESIGIAEFDDKYPQYLSRLAASRNSPLDLAALRRDLENERYILRSEKGAELFDTVNSALEIMPFRDKTAKEALMQANSGDINTIRALSAEVRSGTALADALVQMKGALPPGMSMSSIEYLLSFKPKSLTSAEEDAYRKDLSSLREDHNKKLKIAVESGDPEEEVKVLEEFKRLHTSLDNMYFFPGETRSTTVPPPEIAMRDAQRMGDTYEDKLNRAMMFDLGQQGSLAGLSNYLNTIPNDQPITGLDGKQLTFGKASPKEKYMYMAQLAREQKDTQNAKAFETVVKAIDAQVVSPKEYQETIDRIREANPNLSEDQLTSIARESLERIAANRSQEILASIGAKDINITGNAAQWLLPTMGIEQVVRTWARGYSEPFMRPTRLASGRFGPAEPFSRPATFKAAFKDPEALKNIGKGAVLRAKEVAGAFRAGGIRAGARAVAGGVGRAAGGRLVANPIGAAAAVAIAGTGAVGAYEQQAKGYYDPNDSFGRIFADPFMASLNSLAGKGHVTRADLLEMKNKAEARETRELAQSYAREVAKMVALSRDYKTSAPALRQAIDNATEYQALLQPRLVTNPELADQFTSLEHFLEKDDWRRVANAFSRLNEGQSLRSYLTMQEEGGSPINTVAPREVTLPGSSSRRPNFGASSPPPGTR